MLHESHALLSFDDDDFHSQLVTIKDFFHVSIDLFSRLSNNKLSWLKALQKC